MLGEFIPCSPVLNPEFVVVHDDGELPRGLYYYVITAIGDKESIPSHILQVFAGNKHNSISFEWKTPEGVREFRLYRGTILGHYDGYFTVYSAKNICYFFDNGLGELNLDICPSTLR